MDILSKVRLTALSSVIVSSVVVTVLAVPLAVRETNSTSIGLIVSVTTGEVADLLGNMVVSVAVSLK